MLVQLTNLYPVALMLVFLVFFFTTDMPAKGQFALRAFGALVIAVVLAHINRWFHLWPAHLLFPSGHMTFCLGLSCSLGLLRPWTLLITLPLVVPFGVLLVYLHFHTIMDVLGSFPLVMVVYGIAYRKQVVSWISPAPASLGK